MYQKTEPVLLTESEWRVRDAKRECSRHGHDWSFTYTLESQIPISMHCDRPCGVGAFKVEPFNKE